MSCRAMLPGVASNGTSGSAATASIRSRTARASVRTPGRTSSVRPSAVESTFVPATAPSPSLGLLLELSSPLSSIAACAAARRATGRRYGEQLT